MPREQVKVKKRESTFAFMRLAIWFVSLAILNSSYEPLARAAEPAVSESKPADERALKDIRDLVKKVQERYDHLKDLQADFQQSTKIEGFEKTLLSSGQLYLKRPGRLRWDYREPTPEEIYVRQNDVMMYVPEHQQVLVGKLTQLAASQAPLQLLQGLSRLEDHFTLQSVKGGRRGEGGLPLIALYPKGADDDTMRTVDHITLEVQPKLYVLKTVAIHEVGGNVSTFRFTNIRTNSGLGNELFDFKPPEGVEVVKAPSLAPP
jgi:outer membrane lipoprotein carrier protein